ncbi:MAG TPA: hypothetical protein VGM93_14885 [Acidimicrobiales bacterium]|jgi:hypothetical protein
MAPTIPTVRYGTIDTDYAARLATTPPDDDGPIWMVNLMHYRDRADYGAAGGPDVSGREADDLYAPLDELHQLGAEIVFLADVDSQLLGDAPQWDRVAVVKYPSRRAFIELQELPTYPAKHVHKEAGMEQTFVIGTQPIAAPEVPADRPEWTDVPHPPTAEDPSVVVIHVLKFVDEGLGEMDQYTNHAGTIAVPHGVRIAGWFGVEGTIVGDGRAWDQVRFNAFPSREAFMAVVFDPERLKAQGDHREPAIADTYTMILRPMIDRLTESIG